MLSADQTILVHRQSESCTFYNFSIRNLDGDLSPRNSAFQRIIDRSSGKRHLIWEPMAKRVRSPRQDPSALAFSSAKKRVVSDKIYVIGWGVGGVVGVGLPYSYCCGHASQTVSVYVSLPSHLILWLPFAVVRPFSFCSRAAEHGFPLSSSYHR